MTVLKPHRHDTFLLTQIIPQLVDEAARTGADPSEVILATLLAASQILHARGLDPVALCAVQEIEIRRGDQGGRVLQ